jgi:KipI family sensor histidine kinase inhibitor
MAPLPVAHLSGTELHAASDDDMPRPDTDDRAEPPRVEMAGDGALVVTLGARMDLATSRRVLALAARIAAAPPAGVVETVPGIAALTVHIDPERTDAKALVDALADMAAEPLEGRDVTAAARHWTVPVCYEPEFATDLDEVAERTGLAPGAVVDRHAGVAYHVYMLGFLPGFPYLGDLDPALRLPRRATPRVVVPAGSVAIAEAMTAIYPQDSPGGWHIIGRTPVRLFDPAADPPSLIAPGDSVRFQPISRDAFARLAAEAAAGRSVIAAIDEAMEATR